MKNLQDTLKSTKDEAKGLEAKINAMNHDAVGLKQKIVQKEEEIARLEIKIQEEPSDQKARDTIIELTNQLNEMKKEGKDNEEEADNLRKELASINCLELNVPQLILDDLFGMRGQ
jgi:chromosome segregation ATPase